MNTTTITCQLAEFWTPNLLACEDFFSHLQFVNQSSKDIELDAVRENLEEFDDRLTKQVPKDWRLKEYRRRIAITLAGKVTYLRRICRKILFCVCPEVSKAEMKGGNSLKTCSTNDGGRPSAVGS